MNYSHACAYHCAQLSYTTLHRTVKGPDLQKKNLRKNPKFIISFSYVYLKLILSYKGKIF